MFMGYNVHVHVGGAFDNPPTPVKVGLLFPNLLGPVVQSAIKLTQG